jgi:ABC-type transport system substrate-binding protein
MHRSAQVTADGDWVAAYPYPSSYVPSFVSCDGGTSNGYYCNPSLDREMREAGLLELGDPSKASALWQSIDRQLTNEAVWVPTVTQRDIEITSSRLRNYQYNPVWGFLADQAWLR